MTNASLISHDESTAFKGVYILLIAIAHNYFFTTATESLQLMSYFYMFHIAGFFILPVMYGGKKLSWHNVATNAARLLWPFLLLTILFYFIFNVWFNHNSFDISELGKTLIYGSSVDLSHYCGFQILWFLPAMFSLLIIRDFYFSVGKAARLIIYLAATLCLCSYFAKMLIGSDPMGWTNWIPLQFSAAFSYLSIGLTVRWVISHFYHPTFTTLSALIIAIALTILYFCNIPDWYSNVWSWQLGRIFFPGAFFLLLWRFKESLTKVGVFNLFGKYSLPVYLVHPFIGFTLIMLLSGFAHYSEAIKIIIITITLVFIPGFALALSILATKLKPLYQLFLPHDINQWKQIFTRR